MRGSIKISESLGFVLGALTAEGNGSVFVNTCQEFLNEYCVHYEKVFGTTALCAKVDAREHQNFDVYYVQPSSKYAEKILAYLLNSGSDCTRLYSHEKTVPSFIRQAGKKVQSQFLRAWFEGDGEIFGIESGTASYRLSGGSCSERLCREINLMLVNMGIKARTGVREPVHSWHTTQGNREGRNGKSIEKRGFGVQVPSTQIAKFQELIGFVSTRKVNHLNKSVRKQRLAAENTKQGSINLLAQGMNNRVPASVVTAVLEQIETYASTLIADHRRDRRAGAAHPPARQIAHDQAGGEGRA